MASFLDNTNDIILDAVLTDYGRQLLAKGDGSFNVVKFAFGDEEIDYALFNTGAVSPNQDTEIMSTPIMEAFTNNAASMKSKLLTIKDNNLLFLPVLKLNDKLAISRGIGDFNSVFSGYVVPVDTSFTTNETSTALTGSDAGKSIEGVVGGAYAIDFSIAVDQGINSSKTDPKKSLAGTALYETSYNVYIDSRLGYLPEFNSPLSIDDDGIATYQISDGNPNFAKIPTNDPDYKKSTITGNKGSRVFFKIAASDNLLQDTLFNRLGSSGVALNSQQAATTFKVIRSVITVEGATTGFMIDIPILFAKKE